jgi:hypothetical protein
VVAPPHCRGANQVVAAMFEVMQNGGPNSFVRVIRS